MYLTEVPGAEDILENVQQNDHIPLSTISRYVEWDLVSAESLWKEDIGNMYKRWSQSPLNP
jgi:hypothetical protein